MQLSQSIKLRQKQSLVMTPQLQQAIKLLQMSNLELSQHLQEQMYDNPFLEVKPAGEGEAVSMNAPQKVAETAAPDAAAPSAANEIGAGNVSTALGDDPTQHTDMDNRFDTALVDMPKSGGGMPLGGGDDDFNLIENAASEEGFYQLLFKQMNLTFTETSDRLIAGHFINALEPSGWINRDVADIAAECGCADAQAEQVLSVLQTFEPAGLFARNLAECLKLQLIDSEEFTPEFAILLDNLELLGRGELRPLAKRLKCEQKDIVEMLGVIRSLNPKPGEHLGISYREVPSPDVIVTRRSNGWSVELNKSTLPAVLVNEDYAEMMANQVRNTNNAMLNQYAQDQVNFDNAMTQAQAAVKQQPLNVISGAAQDYLKNIYQTNMANTLEGIGRQFDTGAMNAQQTATGGQAQGGMVPIYDAAGNITGYRQQ